MTSKQLLQLLLLLCLGTASFVGSSESESPGMEDRHLTGLPEVALVGANGNPVQAFPLGLCEGDCDNDSDVSAH